MTAIVDSGKGGGWIKSPSQHVDGTPSLEREHVGLAQTLERKGDTTRMYILLEDVMEVDHNCSDILEVDLEEPRPL